jgi:uridine kinase
LQRAHSKPFIVGICGGSGSGKTTIVRMLSQHFDADDFAVLAMDHYYRDFSRLPPQQRDLVNFDSPDAFDLELLVAHVEDLSESRGIDRPTYDFATHSRIAPRVRLEPKRTIVLDGMMALHHEPLRELFDLSVFVDVPADLRFIRRLQRDVAERGRTHDSVVQQYLSTVKPMHELYVEPQRHIADVIVGWTNRSETAIKMLARAVANT